MRLNTGRTPSAWRRAFTSTLGGLCQHRKPRIGKAHGLQRPHAERVPRAGRFYLILLSISTMPRNFRQKPRVDLAGSEDLVIAPAEPHRLRDLQQTIRRRRAQC